LRCQSPIPARARGPSATRADLNNRISPVLGKLWHLNFYTSRKTNKQTNKQRNKQRNKETNKANKQTPPTTTTATTTKYKQSFIILGKPDTIQAWRYQIYLQPGQRPTCRVKQVRQAGSGTDRQVSWQAGRHSSSSKANRGKNDQSIHEDLRMGGQRERPSIDIGVQCSIYVKYSISHASHIHTHIHIQPEAEATKRSATQGQGGAT
jgi:hypothetical protein